MSNPRKFVAAAEPAEPAPRKKYQRRKDTVRTSPEDAFASRLNRFNANISGEELIEWGLRMNVTGKQFADIVSMSVRKPLRIVGDYSKYPLRCAEFGPETVTVEITH